MPDNATIRFEGMREFRRDLRRVSDGMEDLKSTHLEAAEVVKPLAIRLAPFLTGELRDTIRTAGTKTQALVRAGYKRTPYAGPIHFGWPKRGISPQPFLYDAMDKRRDEVLDIYADRLHSLAQRYGLDVRRAVG